MPARLSWEAPKMLEAIAPLLALTQASLVGLILVFTRVAGVVALLPAFGEQSIPVRFRMAIVIAFTMIIWPIIGAEARIQASNLGDFAPLILSESFVGLLIGLSVRLVLIALQFAGSIASQSASLTQMMGAGATPDPMPAIGNILVLGGLVLALSAGLHVKAASAITSSYQIVPMGEIPDGTDIANWGVAKASAVAQIAFTLAAPFLIASLAYNLMLGFINRAMPQLMVAFIGAPAITAGGIFLLFLSAPALLVARHAHLDQALLRPFGMP